MREALLAWLLVSACNPSGDSADASVDPCSILFGNPVEQTGLGPDQCRPSCNCRGVIFKPPTYDDAFIQSLIDNWQLATPFPMLASDPYAQAAPPDDPAGTVCAVLPEGDAKPRMYELVTYPSMDGAIAAGAHPTHFGHCGVCSTLANLAVYMRSNDLSKPVRACAFAMAADGGDADVQCLMGLGFDLPCAQIWAYNTAHTRSACLTPCLANLNAPYNLPDGTLNPCLRCDEDQSGPVFKAVAGRTRRNSGLPNAICRPCSEVQALVHAY
jgi:hypothetical protein